MAEAPVVKFFAFTDSGFTQGDTQLSNVTTAEAWQSDKLYYVGDTVLYNGTYYQCKLQHTSTASPTPNNDATNWGAQGKWNVTSGGTGNVKAGTASNSLFLRIWNNKGQTDPAKACSNMQDCKLFIKDGSQSISDGDITLGGWLKARCISLGENWTYTGTPSPVNIADAHAIKEDNTTYLSFGSSTMSDFQISGATNDGGNEDTANYSDNELVFVVPNGATHGTKEFSIYVSYFFV